MDEWVRPLLRTKHPPIMESAADVYMVRDLQTALAAALGLWRRKRVARACGAERNGIDLAGVLKT